MCVLSCVESVGLAFEETITVAEKAGKGIFVISSDKNISLSEIFCTATVKNPDDVRVGDFADERL